MRPLTDEETKVFFEKLAKYIGKNIRYLIDRDDQEYCFRLHNNRVHYCTVEMANKAQPFARKELISFGVIFGKFTKHGNFRLHITALDYIAQYALVKVWVKEEAEMPFMYGDHLTKRGVSRVSDDMARNVGCVIFNENDMAIGFGTTACSAVEFSRLNPTAIVCYNQADLGEYLREEDTMMTQQ